MRKATIADLIRLRRKYKRRRKHLEERRQVRERARRLERAIVIFIPENYEEGRIRILSLGRI